MFENGNENNPCLDRIEILETHTLQKHLIHNV
jgi:hypothetical protein